MRWDELFADLEGQAAADADRDLDAEVADLALAEVARLPLADRLRGNLGADVTVSLHGVAEPLRGRLVRVGSGWALLALRADGYAGRSDAVVPLAGVTGVAGLGGAAAPATGTLAARLPVGGVLRAVAERREPVRLLRTDGTTVTGPLGRVGADAVDVRTDAGPVVVPLAAVAAVVVAARSVGEL